jgi:hypothetical protein
VLSLARRVSYEPQAALLLESPPGVRGYSSQRKAIAPVDLKISAASLKSGRDHRPHRRYR